MVKKKEENNEAMQEEVKKSKDEIKKENFEKLKQQSEEVSQEFKKALMQGEIIEEPEYFQMKHYLNMAVTGDETGVIIKSRGGTGKTFTTLTYLAKNNIAYGYLNSFSTVAMFYIWLYKNRNQVKVVDDVHKMLESDKFAPFLKAVLEGYNGKRVVFYNTTKPIEDSEGQYPNSFEENGSTIILTNRINEKNIHVDAILTRVPMCELNISNERMLELMACVAKKPYKTLSIKENLEVLEFCKKELRNSVDLNLRTYNHARNFYAYAKRQGDMSLWGRLVLQSLKKDDTDLVIMTVITDEKFTNEDDKLAEINRQLTNPISRATFYRKKKELLGVKSLKSQ